MTNLYPLKFKPILKEKLWGGNALTYKAELPNDDTKIGESWEISGVKDSVSIVTEGELKNQSLNDIISTYKEELLGKSIYKRFGEEFPLLIKFIDAKETLSVQLHPDDEIAKAKHNCMGKTEMWYIMEAKADGFIIADFNRPIDEKTYLNSLKNKDIFKYLKHVNVFPGDVFFIEPGLIHAIGSGVMLAEIQQTSDITYRIYDWDRVDADGKARDLHQKEALDAINFTSREPKVKYKKQPNTINKVVHNPHFKTDYIHIENNLDLDLSKWDSFTILMNVGYEAQIHYNDEVYDLKRQETYLIPANISKVRIEATNTEILMVHI